MRGAKPSYAIASDLSGVIKTEDGFGAFATKLAAIERWVTILEGEHKRVAARLAAAKRQRKAALNEQPRTSESGK